MRVDYENRVLSAEGRFQDRSPDKRTLMVMAGWHGGRDTVFTGSRSRI